MAADGALTPPSAGRHTFVRKLPPAPPQQRAQPATQRQHAFTISSHRLLSGTSTLPVSTDSQQMLTEGPLSSPADVPAMAPVVEPPRAHLGPGGLLPLSAHADTSSNAWPGATEAAHPGELLRTVPATADYSAEHAAAGGGSAPAVSTTAGALLRPRAASAQPRMPHDASPVTPPQAQTPPQRPVQQRRPVHPSPRSAHPAVTLGRRPAQAAGRAADRAALFGGLPEGPGRGTSAPPRCAACAVVVNLLSSSLHCLCHSSRSCMPVHHGAAGGCSSTACMQAITSKTAPFSSPNHVDCKQIGCSEVGRANHASPHALPAGRQTRSHAALTSWPPSAAPRGCLEAPPARPLTRRRRARCAASQWMK